jgi:hypothetical protein
MAFKTRNMPDAMVFALVAAWNHRQEAAVSTFFHADITQVTTDADYRAPTVTNDTVTAANGTDLTTNITLVNQMKAVMNRHFVDPRAHNTAVSAVVATANATDLATAVTLVNALKAAYNTGGHINGAGIHFTNDGTNTVAAANATDLATLQTLNNEMKGDFNAHVISAPAGAMIQLVDA